MGYLGYLSVDKDTVWALQMVQRGFEVWLNNSRGTKYSYRHERDGEWSLKEKWDFTFADMGIYDVPASIEHVLEVTGAEKVTVVGHSQGTSQMWYGMSHLPDYFSEKVNRFVALSSCTVPIGYPNLPADFNGLAALFVKAEELGLYNVNGSDESSVGIIGLFCVMLEDPLFCLADEYYVQYAIDNGIFYADAQSM